VRPTKEINVKTQPKSRRGLIQHRINPFVSSVLVERKTKRLTNKKGDMMVMNDGTGEVVAPAAGFWQAKEVDGSKFVKLYVNGVKAFRDLTSAGARLFEILYLEVRKNIGQDVIWLSFNEVDQTMTPMGKATFMRGMRELIEKGFLAESITQSKYFLNPDYLWNGDRLAFVKEYYKAPSQPTLPSEVTEEGLP
jgi:hypothetical protein